MSPVRGLFQLHDTRGFTLDIAVMICASRGLIPDLLGFCTDALNANWSERKIRATIIEAVSIYGVEHQAQVARRLDKAFAR